MVEKRQGGPERQEEENPEFKARPGLMSRTLAKSKKARKKGRKEERLKEHQGCRKIHEPQGRKDCGETVSEHSRTHSSSVPYMRTSHCSNIDEERTQQLPSLGERL